MKEIKNYVEATPEEVEEWLDEQGFSINNIEFMIHEFNSTITH